MYCNSWCRNLKRNKVIGKLIGKRSRSSFKLLSHITWDDSILGNDCSELLLLSLKCLSHPSKEHQLPFTPKISLNYGYQRETWLNRAVHKFLLIPYVQPTGNHKIFTTLKYSTAMVDCSDIIETHLSQISSLSPPTYFQHITQTSCLHESLHTCLSSLTFTLILSLSLMLTPSLMWWTPRH